MLICALWRDGLYVNSNVCNSLQRSLGIRDHQIEISSLFDLNCSSTNASLCDFLLACSRMGEFKNLTYYLLDCQLHFNFGWRHKFNKYVQPNACLPTPRDSTKFYWQLGFFELSWVGSHRHVVGLRRRPTTASWFIWRFLTCLESVASRNQVGIIPANQHEVGRVTSRPVYKKCTASPYCVNIFFAEGDRK